MATSKGRLVLSEVAYEEIRAALVRGDIEPGARLAEVGLAERFKMSRTPIREALRRLEAEHLVVREGASLVASPYDPTAGIELMVIRELLEPRCAETSAPQLSGSDIRRLRLIAAETSGDDDPLVQAELNNDFHNLLYSRCPYPRLLGDVNALREHLVTYRLYAGYEPADLVESNRDHERLAALAGKVATGASQPREIGLLIAAHIVRARESLERNLSPDGGVE
ncbi:MAG TPA: GntR family transcriptional regulator [Solirubrobacterales bacterium]|jgi:DNA-binding GntR family transcriptional regulator